MIVAISVLAALLVGTVAVVALMTQPKEPAVDPTAAVWPPPGLPPPPKPVVEPKPKPTTPEQEPLAPVAVAPVDDGHRTLKLLADTHVVAHRPARTQWKQLGEDTSWRVSLVEPGPVLANVQLEFEDARGKQLVPIASGETLKVSRKRSVGVVCEPGARAAPEQVGVLMLNSSSGTQRLRIDPLQCADYEQAKRIELDHEKHYTLTFPTGGDVNLGEGAPVRVAWRVRLTDGAFSAGALKPGASTAIDGAVFLEVGFFDQSVSDNSGFVELALDTSTQAAVGAGAGGTVARVGKETVGPSMPYAESLNLPVVQRARALMHARRVPEVLPAIAPCFKEPTPVPECYRLEGEAYVRLDQPERALVSYRRFLELAGDDHPARHSVGEYVRDNEQ